MSDWKMYLNKNGDFELANFLYKKINSLMKQSLDMGTLLSSDAHKLRAYKEQTKKLFKQEWFDVAEAMEFFGIIEKCACATLNKDAYCEACKGARYVTSSFLSPDSMREIGVFTNAGLSAELADKLQKSLQQAISDLS